MKTLLVIIAMLTTFYLIGTHSDSPVEPQPHSVIVTPTLKPERWVSYFADKDQSFVREEPNCGNPHPAYSGRTGKLIGTMCTLADGSLDLVLGQ